MKTIKRLDRILWLAVAFGILAMPASIMAHGIDFSQYRDDNRPDRAGVLVIALVPPDATTAAKQEMMDQRIKETFPGMDVQWAYFNLGGGQAEAFTKTDAGTSPKQVLDQMEEDGITHVAILPLAVIPGETYNRLVWMVDTLRKMPVGFRKIALAKPFFGAPADIGRTCQTVLDLLPDRTNDEAVVLFFEEQSLLGDLIYPGLQYFFWQLDESVFIGTAGTTPGTQDVSQSLQVTGARTVFLVPFLPYQTQTLSEWAKALEESGIRVKVIQAPVIGQKAAQEVMMLRLEAAMRELGLGAR